MPPRALTLPDGTARDLARGAHELDFGKLPDPGAAQQPGTLLHLLDGRGEHLGTAIADPENGLLRILSQDAIASLGPEFFDRRVERALELRRELGLVEPDATWRLIHGAGDRLGGLTADVYGEFAVVYAYSRGLLAYGRPLAEAMMRKLGLRGVVVKLRERGGARAGKVKQQVVGESPPEKLIVRELGVPYEVHLLGGLNVGLFCDMREHRRHFARYVRGRRVLNTFCYTGAFSVQAALLGASTVTSVDLSKGVLNWAKENFRLSDLDPDADAYRFEASDVFRFLERAREARREFDTIILDPPTYSEARTASWSMKNDYPDLIAAATTVLPASGGLLWIAANAHRGIRVDKALELGLSKARRHGTVIESAGLPPDFPTPAMDPRTRYLQVLVVRVDGE